MLCVLFVVECSDLVVVCRVLCSCLLFVFVIVLVFYLLRVVCFC